MGLRAAGFILIFSIQAVTADSVDFSSFVKRIEDISVLVQTNEISACAGYSYLMGNLYELYRDKKLDADFLEGGLFWLSDYEYIRKNLKDFSDRLEKGKYFSTPIKWRIDNWITPSRKKMREALPSWISSHRGAEPFRQGLNSGYIQLEDDEDRTGRHDHFILNAILKYKFDQAALFTDGIRNKVENILVKNDYQYRAKLWKLLTAPPSFILRHSDLFLRLAGRENESREGNGISKTDLQVNRIGIEFAKWLQAHKGQISGDDINRWIFEHLCDESNARWILIGPFLRPF